MERTTDRPPPPGYEELRTAARLDESGSSPGGGGLPPETEVVEESATIFELSRGCPLCGGSLRGWDTNRPARCSNCGARIRYGGTDLDASMARHPAGGPRAE